MGGGKRKAVDPFVVSLEETCVEENDSQDWPLAMKSNY
jgi:hypothetical protein